VKAGPIVLFAPRVAAGGPPTDVRFGFVAVSTAGQAVQIYLLPSFTSSSEDPMLRSHPLRASAAISLSILAAPVPAAASPTYPGLIDTDLSLDYDLGTTHCTICHTSNSGGIGTAITPFALAMRSAGLTLENPPALQTALATLDANGTDSDCNGTPDIQQIKDGQDPNTGVYINGSTMSPPADPGCSLSDAGSSGGTLPVYGCGAHIAPGGDGGRAPWQATGFLVALAVALGRGRRSSRP
jgi:hypothetical protein